MRLLNVKTLRLESFFHADIPDYAALSHTWGDEEVTFQEISTDSGSRKKGWIKILRSAIEAEKHGCKYIWIDTCCIDKTSSAELSEAINSMFTWYRDSKCCLAYLEDVSIEPKRMITLIEVDSEPVSRPPSPPPIREILSKSRWFTRGWTLQELIAPETLFFYDLSWNILGEKSGLLNEIYGITGIDSDIVRDQKLLYTKSIAEKMSWASQRKTTRTEDVAYCLMGIFAVNMPLLYGEGERAFTRLQEEIMKRNYDHSLFAWNCNFSMEAYGTNFLLEQTPPGMGVLAPHPSAFSNCADIMPYSTETEPYAMTNRGLQIHLHIYELPFQQHGSNHLAVLACRHKDDLDTAIAIPVTGVSNIEFYRTANKNLVDFDYSKLVDSESRTVYLIGTDPIWRFKEGPKFYHSWLCEYGEDVGIKFEKAIYCQYPVPQSRRTYGAVKSWDCERKILTWPKNWSGIRAVLLFSTSKGTSFETILTILHFPVEGGKYSIQLHTRPTSSMGHLHLELILEENLPLNRGNLDYAHETALIDGKNLTVYVQNQQIQDGEVFVVILLPNGYKLDSLESTLKNQFSAASQTG